MLPGNVEELDEWLIEASETERRLPPAFRKQKLASWPSYKTEWLSYGDIVYKPSLPKATTLQVTRYEIILDLLIDYCNTADRKLLWSVAHTAAFRQRGAKWSLLAKKFHKDRRSVKRDYFDALIKLHYNINNKQPKVLYSAN
tara:strand:+ start:59 stop:484 length:426 start_codon:yes stop_codon:yes gene_type:complete